jgi:hypothetical protein
MSAFADLVRFLPVAGGTTDWVVSSAVGGCQLPSAANVVNGVGYKLYAVSTDLTQWEVIISVYNSGATTFPRTTVLYNSSGTGTATGQSGAGTKINFSTIPQVSIVAIAEDLLITRSYLAGLGLSTAGASATFAVAAGQCANSTNIDTMTLAASISKTTSSWAVGSGNGSLDTGAIANSTWYHAYLIKRPDTAVVDVLVSLSATSPTMPTSYTLFRRIGSMLTNGSAQWTAFTQLGDEFIWSTPVQDSTSGAYTTTATLQTLTVPLGIQVWAQIYGIAQTLAANGEILITSPDATDVAASVTAFNIFTPIAATNSTYGVFSIRTNTSSQIRIRASAASTTVYVNTFGWIDRRGRDG